MCEFWGDGEIGQDFEKDGPRGKDDVGGQHEDMGEEAGSLCSGLAGGLPGRVQQFEHGMPGEGEQIEGR